MQRNTKLDDYLTVMSVANVLSCHVNTVRNLINAGKLEAVHVGRGVRVPERSVQQFIDGKGY